MRDSNLTIGSEYGDEYRGTYHVKVLSWKEARELVRNAMKTKDPTSYVEDLVEASVTGPVKVTRESLENLPAGLVRRLMDEALRLNDISKAESTFLSS
jgi:hypothetical protein